MQKEEFIVVENAGASSERIYYSGFNELEAFKKFKSISGKKNIFKANIRRSLFNNVPFITSYEIIEIIK